MQQRLTWLGTLLLSGISLVTLLGFLADYAFLFDIVAHFRLQYVGMLGACLLLFALLRKQGLFWITAGMLVINLSLVIPYYWPNPTTNLTTLGVPVKMLLMNVLSSNTNTAAVCSQVTRFEPDILVLEEITPRWFAALAGLATHYPYQLHAVRDDNFGIWVLSKYPVSDKEIVPWGPRRLPSATLRFLVGQRYVRLIAMHPIAPVSPEGFRWRNGQLRAIAQRYKTSDDPLVVIGDINTTSFVPVFSEFAQTLHLEDSRQGFGLQGSWPAWSFNPFMITLDHCLVSEGTRVIRREVGNYVGSDHLPVYVELVPPD